MPDSLTPKQKQLLQIIKEFIRNKGYSPSLGDLKKLLNVPFVNSVVHLLDKLEEKGFITREKGTERGIVVQSQTDKSVQIPIIGQVACGMPILAEENIEGYISVDKALISSDQTYFFLNAVGDSMDQAGIQDGDLVLVKAQKVANPNEKIVALIDDEATIKFYKPSGSYVALVPRSSNPDNKPIIVRDNFQIQGVVETVFSRDSLIA